MENKASYKKVWVFFIITGTFILGVNLYYFCRPLLDSLGWTHYAIDEIIFKLRDGEILSTPFRTKIWVLSLLGISLVVRGGKGKDTPWWLIAVPGILGGVLYFLPFHNCRSYLYLTFCGLGLLCWSLAMAGRRLHSFHVADNDRMESFQQSTRKIETDGGVNLKMRFKYKKTWHNGWINVVSPERGSLVLGVPGSGKSFCIFEPFIEQMIEKGNTMFVYDYKYPTLSRIVYNELERNTDKYSVTPEFRVINFKDPRYSLRCNPIHPRYITDSSDATEIAELIMQNINRGIVDKEDFFSNSAKEFLDSCINFLHKYEGGKYCTIPHVIEFMGQDYKKTIEIMSGDPELEVKIRPFKNALSGGAPEQLQGQMASAQIPLNKLISPIFYWILSGDDFSLDINDPEHPKVLCIGNDPDRDMIYGVALALITSRMFKLINHPGKLPCFVAIDELPTFYIKGLDKIIATARSNKVKVMYGAQDKSQLIRDYKEHEAEVLFNTVGNIFSGQVNGKTAEDMSRTFDKEFRRRESQTQGLDNESVNISYQKEELLPRSTIETLSQGCFFGKVADDYEHPIEEKLFYGKVIIDTKAQKKRRAGWTDIPQLTSFGEDKLRARIMANQETYLRKYFMMKITENDVVCDEEELEKQLKQMISAATEDQKKDILNEIIEKATAELVPKVLESNMKRIRDEVKAIIDKEAITPGPEAEAQKISEEAEKMEEIQNNAKINARNAKVDAVK